MQLFRFSAKMPEHQSKSVFLSNDNDENEDKILLQPCLDLDIKEQLEYKIFIKTLEAFNYWFKITSNDFKKVTTFSEIFCTRETIIDDIQDGSLIRYSRDAAHVKHGLAKTINACEYIMGVFLQKMFEFPDPLEAFRILTVEQLNCHRGQGMEIHRRENFICPTEEEYKREILRKDHIIITSVNLMQLFSDNKEDFSKLTKLLTVYFQLSNDLVNLTSKKYMESKGCTYDDINEGKFSFPIIHAINSRPDDDRIISILKLKNKDEGVKKYCVSLLEEFGSFKYTQETLRLLKMEMKQEILKHGGNSFLVKSLDNYEKYFL